MTNITNRSIIFTILLVVGLFLLPATVGFDGLDLNSQEVSAFGDGGDPGDGGGSGGSGGEGGSGGGPGGDGGNEGGGGDDGFGGGGNPGDNGGTGGSGGESGGGCCGDDSGGFGGGGNPGDNGGTGGSGGEPGGGCCGDGGNDNDPGDNDPGGGNEPLCTDPAADNVGQSLPCTFTNLTAPAISIVKRAIDGSDSQIVPTTGTANFEIVVTNTGDEALVNVVVSDPLEADCNRTIGALAIGASNTYTCSTANVTADFTNVANVTGNSAVDNDTVTDSDPTTVTHQGGGGGVLPQCDTFTANGQSGTLTLTAAGTVNLAWTTTNATQVTIDNSVGVFTGSDVDGNTAVNVVADTTFTLIPNDGTVDGTACTVAVEIVPVVVNNSQCDLFTIDRNEVGTNAQFGVEWETNGIVSVDVVQDGVVVASDQGPDSSIALIAPRDGDSTSIVLRDENDNNIANCAGNLRVDEGGGGGGGGGGSSSPRCTFDASDESISAGDEITLSWTTRRTNEITIYENSVDDDNEIFSTDDNDDVDEGDITVRPRSNVTYIMVAERGSRDRECEVEIELDDDVVVLESRNQPAVAGIALTQVPHTGFEAGPTLTFIFYLLLAIWGAFVAYVYLYKRNPEVATGATLEQDEFEKKVQRLTDLYSGRNLM